MEPGERDVGQVVAEATDRQLAVDVEQSHRRAQAVRAARPVGPLPARRTLHLQRPSFSYSVDGLERIPESPEVSLFGYANHMVVC